MKAERNSFELGSSRYEFRGTDADTKELLAGVYFDYGSRTRQEDYSPDKFWLDLRRGGRSRRATKEEWDAGFRLGTLRAPYSNGPFIVYPPKDSEDLVLQGKSFKKSGTLWPSFLELTRVSQDGQWLMVNSMGGARHEQRGGGNGIVTLNLDFFKPHRETFFIDIYKFATAQRIVAIHGSAWGEDIASPGDVAVWLQSRYFVIPIEPHFKKLLVCDMEGLPPAKKKPR